MILAGLFLITLFKEVRMSEFFKLLEAVFKLERVLHCNREQAKRFVAACYVGTAYNGKCPPPKLDLFMKGGVFALFACADDGGRRICKAIADALEADGLRFNVDLDERDEAGSFKDVEFDNPDDYTPDLDDDKDEDDDLGHLTLNVQAGDMSLLWTVFSGYMEDCIGSEDPDNMQERKRVADLHERFTMGADPQRAIQIDLRDGDVEACHIDGVKQENISVALQGGCQKVDESA